MIIKRSIRYFKQLLGLGNKPDFFIVGAQKSGTTSLYEYLVKSSADINPASSKELYFFTEREGLGQRFYESFFPACKAGKLTGEATPDYFFYHACPEKVYKYNPNAKIIIILRDPVERAFSQYCHQNFTSKTKAYDPLSFSKAIREEENRFNVDSLSKFFYEYKYYSYKARGLYYEQLKNWLGYFDKNSICVVFLEDLKADPAATVKSTLLFLGVKRINVDVEFPIKNKSPGSKINKEDEQYLRDFYKSDSEKLFEFLNDKPRWKL